MAIAQLNDGRDLAGRDDIEALLRRFYGKALYDDMLAEPFVEIRARGLESHLPVMCDFWETVLFRAGRYRRNALHAHQHVQQRVPLSARHFLRWLTLWNATVDQMYRGPVAEHAKIQAARIATSLHRRLTGTHAPELEVSAASQASISRASSRAYGTRIGLVADVVRTEDVPGPKVTRRS